MARSRDIKTETHLRAMAFWYRVHGVMLGGLSLIMFLLILGSDPVDLMALGEAGAYTAAFVLFFINGHYLKKYNDLARVFAGILALASLTGTLIDAIVERESFVIMVLGTLLYYTAAAGMLFSRKAKRVCSGKYRKLVARSGFVRIRITNSVFFWIPMILTSLVVMVFLLLMLLMVDVISRY